MVALISSRSLRYLRRHKIYLPTVNNLAGRLVPWPGFELSTSRSSVVRNKPSVDPSATENMLDYLCNSFQTKRCFKANLELNRGIHFRDTRDTLG